MKRVYYEFFGEELSPEQMRAVSLLVQGYTAEQSAEKMEKSKKTVQNQLDSVYAKLNIHYSHHLIAVALLSGFDEKGFYKGEDLFSGMVLKALPKGTDVCVADIIARGDKKGNTAKEEEKQ